MAEIDNVTLGGAEGAQGEPNGNHEGQTGGEESKTYTQEEFTAEVDRRVTEAVKTAVDNAKSKWQVEYEEKLKTEKDEAARLAKMSADERAKEEFKKEREQFNTERTAYQKEKLEYECAKQLTDAGMSPKFASFLTGENAETTKTNIDTFKTAFDKAVEAMVTDRLKGEPPKTHVQPETDPFLNGLGL